MRKNVTAILAFLGFWVLLSLFCSCAPQESVEIEMSASPAPALGETTTVKVTVKARDIDLENVVVEIRHPRELEEPYFGFKLVSGAQRWEFASLPAYKEKTFQATYKAIAVGWWRLEVEVVAEFDAGMMIPGVTDNMTYLIFEVEKNKGKIREH